MALLDIQHVLDLLDGGQAAQAVPLLSEWSERTPAYATPHILLARAYEALGRWDDARNAWQHAHFLLPNSPVVQEGLQRVHEAAAATAPESEHALADLDVAGTLDLDEPFDAEKAVDADLAALDLEDDLSVTLEPVDTHLEPVDTHLEPLDAPLENLAVDPLFEDFDLGEPSAEADLAPASEEGAPSDTTETAEVRDEDLPFLEEYTDTDEGADTAESTDIEVQETGGDAEIPEEPEPADLETEEPEPPVEAEAEVAPPAPPEPAETDALVEDAGAEASPAALPDEEDVRPEETSDEPVAALSDAAPPSEEAPRELDVDVFPLDTDEPTEEDVALKDEPERTSPSADDDIEATEADAEDYVPAVRAALAAAEADAAEASEKDPSGTAKSRSIYEEIDELIDRHGEPPSPDDLPLDAPDLDISAFDTSEGEVDLETWDDFEPVPDAEEHPPLAAPVDDLDRLIEELESARIVPNPDPDDVPDIELDDEIDDVVSETLARIYASQNQYHEAARVYEQLALQQPDRAEHFQQQAAEMRAQAGD